MGLFGNNQKQDARLDSIEEWLQGLTGVVQKHRLDLAELRVDFLKLQNQVDEKLESGDFDPAIMQLSERIAEARAMAQQAAGSAGEGWVSMQRKAMEALEHVGKELEAVAERLDNA